MSHDIRRKSSFLALVLKIGLPLLIVAAGAASAYKLYDTRPVAKRTRPLEAAPLVRTMRAEATTMPVSVTATGTVRAAREIALKPRVAGRVEQMSPSFTPGGVLREGEMLLRLDESDFRLAVDEKKADVTKAEADLELEMGQQYVAREEWKHLLGEKTLKTALALRKPQLAQAQAALDAAKAAQQKAELDLTRTVVRAPFNALVTARNVDVGSQVSTADTLATLAGTDEYWIEISVPMDRLRWIDLPGSNAERGSPATVSVAAGERRGRVLRLLGELQSDSRMARVLVSVHDPLLLAGTAGPAAARLILGDYVSVAVQGREVQNAVRLPRSALRDDDTVWVVRDAALSIRKVHTVWKDRDDVFVDSGLAPGENVVVSNLSSPIEGMSLRVEGAPARKDAQKTAQANTTEPSASPTPVRPATE
jgi:RND family efflux transporter MFP subunit